MEAGKELDRAIAESVFCMVECYAWEPVCFGSAGGWVLQKTCDHEDGKCWPSTTIPSFHGEVGGLPKYSTDPFQNRKVVEYLEDNNAIVEVSYDAAHWGGKIADGVKPLWIPDSSGRVWIEGKSFEQLICLLALRLVTNQ